MARPIFEIHAAGLDANAVQADIEQELRAQALDPALVRRVEELSFTPVAPTTDGGFDPALTAELFEHPVALPDFRSRKYRFVRGPLRALANALFRLLVQVDEKLSENKVQSFHHVVHELIRLSHRFESLLSRYALLEEEVLALRAAGGRGVRPVKSAAPEELPPPPSELARRHEELASELSALLERGSALTLDDAWGHFAHSLERVGFSVACSMPEESRAGVAAAARSFEVAGVESTSALLGRAVGSLHLVTHLALENLSGDGELFIELLGSRVAPGGVALLCWNEATAGALQARPRFTVDPERLHEELSRVGFESIQERRRGRTVEWLCRRRH